MTLGDLLAATAGHAPDLAPRWGAHRVPHVDRAADAPVAGGDERFARGRARIGVRGLARPQGGRRGVCPRRDRARRHRRGRRDSGAAGDDGPLAAGGGRAARARGALGGLLRQSEQRPPARRHHRHQRQDHDLVPARVDLRSGRHPLRAHRHRRLPRRRSGSGRDENHAGSAGAAPHAARDGRRRVRRLRDGGVVARARAPARRLPALQRRHLHQPDARPPRLPPRHGGVLPRQAAAVRAVAARRRRRHAISTTVAARPSPPSPSARSRTRSTRPRTSARAR